MFLTGSVSAVRRAVFDGVCLLCSTFIHFVLDNDEAGAFDFASLQGKAGTALLTKHGLPLDVSTMVLIDEHDQVHTRSTAALKVLQRCRWPFCLAYAAIALPRPVRDLGYRTVAAMRYRLFGKDDGETCRMMTKAIRHRFL
jgi:predicted DCC family thiol-disulfide oxidoreductase YuxK